MKLTPADEAKLQGVHPDLVKVIRRAAGIYLGTFTIIEGARSVAAQRKNIAAGVSQTSRSRHVPANNKSRMSCAVDCAPVIKGRIPWKMWNLFEDLNKTMQQAGKGVGVPVEWGGAWATLKDGDHWQLPWKKYP